MPRKLADGTHVKSSLTLGGYVRRDRLRTTAADVGDLPADPSGVAAGTGHGADLYADQAEHAGFFPTQTLLQKRRRKTRPSCRRIAEIRCCSTFDLKIQE
jgi:hypothetical protein